MGKVKTVLGWGSKLLGGLGSHTKGAAALVLGGSALYNYNQSGQGALSTWGDLLLGKETMDKAKHEGAGEVVGDFLLGDGNTDKVVDKGKDFVSGVGDAISGVREGSSGLFGGISNLLGGVFSGGTSSLVGLIAAGMMLFGNFGWMGKIVCGLIAAMSFGLFGGSSQQQAVSQQQLPVQSREDGRVQDYTRGTDVNDEDNGQAIYRPRR